MDNLSKEDLEVIERYGKLPEVPKITVGDLKRDLSLYDDDTEVSFSGLTFYRLKQRGSKLVQVEFGQSVYRNFSGSVTIDNVDSKDCYKS